MGRIIVMKFKGICTECKAQLQPGQSAYWYAKGRVACTHHDKIQGMPQVINAPLPVENAPRQDNTPKAPNQYELERQVRALQNAVRQLINATKELRSMRSGTARQVIDEAINQAEESLSK
jgi:hypothetical protein